MAFELINAKILGDDLLVLHPEELSLFLTLSLQLVEPSLEDLHALLLLKQRCVLRRIEQFSYPLFHLLACG